MQCVSSLSHNSNVDLLAILTNAHEVVLVSPPENDDAAQPGAVGQSAGRASNAIGLCRWLLPDRTAQQCQIEVGKAGKRVVDKAKFVKALETKMAAPKYQEKVPDAVKAKDQAKLSAMSNELESLEDTLMRLQIELAQVQDKESGSIQADKEREASA